MTILNTKLFRIDGISLATYATGLETIDGEHGFTDARQAAIEVAFAHGHVPEYDLFRQAAVIPYQLYVAGTDADGAITHAEGERGHIETNMKALQAVLMKKGAAITVEHDVPKASGAGVETLQASGYCVNRPRLSGSRAIRDLRFDLVLPYPFWHVLPQVTASGLSGTFTRDTSPSTAPIADMVVTFSGGTNARLTVNNGPWAGQYIEIIGATPGGGVRFEMWKDGFKRATLVSGGAYFDDIDYNSAAWMEWEPGNAAVSMTLTGGGTVALAYYQARH